MKILIALIFLIVNTEARADILGATFLKVQLGITPSELNDIFTHRKDIIFLDTSGKIINGKLLDGSPWGKISKPFYQLYASQCIIEGDTLDEATFHFFRNKLYKIEMNLLGNEDMIQKKFIQDIGKNKVKRGYYGSDKIDIIYWRDTTFEIRIYDFMPYFPGLQIVDLATEKEIMKYENIKIQLLPYVSSTNGKKVKDSLLHWGYSSDEYEISTIESISVDCNSLKYILLEGNVSGITISLMCFDTGEIIYQDENVNLNKKLKLFHNSDIWFGKCTDSGEFAVYKIVITKNDYVLFEGRISRETCFVGY